MGQPRSTRKPHPAAQPGALRSPSLSSANSPRLPLPVTGLPKTPSTGSRLTSTQLALAAEVMKKRKNIRILLLQQSPVRASESISLDIQVRLPCESVLLEIEAFVEGRCRATFDGHDNVQTIASLPLDFRPLSNYVQKPPGKAKDAERAPNPALILPAGIHRVISHLRLPSNLPGTFKGRNGAIGYRAIIKVKVASQPRGDELLLEGEKTIDVLGAVPLDSFHGEHILVAGSVENGAHSTALKSINIELRQITQYLNGTTKKNDTRLITTIPCGCCEVQSALTLHHSLQIPANAYPSLVNPNSAVQVFYELHITGGGDRFRVEVPLFVGNYLCSSSPSSSKVNAAKTRPKSASYSSSCTDTTFSAGSDETIESRSEDFVRIHHPFMPVFGMRQMPPFGMPPPPLFPHLHGFHPHPPPRYEPPQNYEPFLKIEEITEDE